MSSSSSTLNDVPHEKHGVDISYMKKAGEKINQKKASSVIDMINGLGDSSSKPSSHSLSVDNKTISSNNHTDSV